MSAIGSTRRGAAHVAVGLGVSVLCAATAAGQAEQLAGEWRGAIHVDNEWSPCRLYLSAQGGPLTGRFDFPPLGIRGSALAASVTDGVLRIVFEETGLARTELTGRAVDGILRAEGAAGAPFVLVKALPQDTSADDALGWYDFEDRPRLFVTRASEHGLRFFTAGVAGTLLPLGPDRYAFAYVDASADIELQELRFQRADGLVTGFELRDPASGAAVRAARVAAPGLRQERVRFRNGAVELSGLLLAPDGEARHPALVFVQGTGYSTADRGYEMTLANVFLAQGFAVLLFDKRGCGGSTGDWRAASLDELAADVAAAVALLQGRADVQPDAVGLYGISEGGWVAPLVAARARDLAFVVNQGGPAVSPLEDELDDMTAGIAALGFEGEDLELVEELASALVEVYRSASARPRFEAARAAAERRPWFARMASRVPHAEDDWRMQWWRKRGRLDPAPVWRDLAVPALVLIGERDDTMAVAKNLERFATYRAHNPRIEVRSVPGADHGLRVGGTLAPGVVEDVAAWARGALGK